MSEYPMSYTPAYEPEQPIPNTSSWVERCPKCRKLKKAISIAKMINAYGCYDFTQAVRLECGHLVMPWERSKK